MSFSILINIDKKGVTASGVINTEKIGIDNSYDLEIVLVKLAEFYNIELDFNNVKMLSSTGIGALVNIYKVSSKNGKKISLINLTETIKQSLELARLEKIFNLD